MSPSATESIAAWATDWRRCSCGYSGRKSRSVSTRSNWWGTCAACRTISSVASPTCRCRCIPSRDWSNPVTDLVMHTFELAAGRTTDITADVYRRYYDRAPDSQALMSHVDHYMQGRMLDEVLTLLMTEAAELPEGYLHFEVANHASYGVQLDMY